MDDEGGRNLLYKPNTERLNFSSLPVPAKSSNAFSVTRDNMFFNKRSSFSGTLFRMFDAAFPFHDGPAGIIVLGQLAEDGFKIYLAIAQ